MDFTPYLKQSRKLCLLCVSYFRLYEDGLLVLADFSSGSLSNAQDVLERYAPGLSNAQVLDSFYDGKTHSWNLVLTSSDFQKIQEQREMPVLIVRNTMSPAKTIGANTEINVLTDILAH